MRNGQFPPRAHEIFRQYGPAGKLFELQESEEPKVSHGTGLIDWQGAKQAPRRKPGSKPKLSKEEKEIAKLEKAAAKGDAKAATKLQHLKLKQSVAARRAAGEEVFTDDELEAAGLT